MLTKIAEICPENPVPHSALKDALLQVFQEDDKWGFETDRKLYERGVALQRWMKDHLARNPIPAGEKIAIVYHSRLIAAMYSTGVVPHPDGPEDGEIINSLVREDYTFPANCEIQPFNL